jgi:hypothetical protein
VVEDLFGFLVADPYRWLEDGLDARVRDWATAQRLFRAIAPVGARSDRERLWWVRCRPSARRNLSVPRAVSPGLTCRFDAGCGASAGHEQGKIGTSS